MSANWRVSCLVSIKWTLRLHNSAESDNSRPQKAEAASTSPRAQRAQLHATDPKTLQQQQITRSTAHKILPDGRTEMDGWIEKKKEYKNQPCSRPVYYVGFS